MITLYKNGPTRNTRYANFLYYMVTIVNENKCVDDAYFIEKSYDPEKIDGLSEN